MESASQKILTDIDATLDQLIQNANIINQISLNPLFQSEAEAMQKTQESLLSRLINMQSLLDNSQPKITTRKKEAVVRFQKKISHFSKLNSALIRQVSNHFMKNKIEQKKLAKPLIRKRGLQTSKN